MKKALITYSTGSGSTETIAEVVAEKLNGTFETNTIEIRREFEYGTLSDYDILVFGFPTYNVKPPDSMMEFMSLNPRVLYPSLETE